MSTMDYPKFSVSNQKEKSISIQRVEQDEHSREMYCPVYACINMLYLHIDQHEIPVLITYALAPPLTLSLMNIHAKLHPLCIIV